jgi:integrase
VAELGAMKNTYREPFKIRPFVNHAGSESWRVDGRKRDGTRVRENFADLKRAEARKLELTTEWLARETDTALRATKLTDVQVKLAEVAFVRLDRDEELMLAVEHWLKHGRAVAVAESPRLDAAFDRFKAWLETEDLRELSKANLRRRVGIFVNGTANRQVSDITPESIDAYLAGRATLTAKSRDNDRRAISRFFSWCMDRPRRWMAFNPASKPKGRHNGAEDAPEILTVEQCEALLRAAESHKDGKLAPYTAVCLFAGLRPFEAARLTWAQVNLEDGEIRLEASQTKTGRPRVVAIWETLRAWLQAYKGLPFFPENWRRDFRVVQEAAGYGTKTAKKPQLKPWPVDVARHTAISHYFRKTGSYGQTAEQFGNSEAIIKRHYQGRVSSEDTKRFYGIMPGKGGWK